MQTTFAPGVDPLIESAGQLLNKFSLEDLNRRKSSDHWSAAQCLRHIQLTNRSYFPGFERILSNEYRPSFWERSSPFTTSTGKNLVDQLGFPVLKKFKAPRFFQPERKIYTPEFPGEFIQHLHLLKTFFNRIDEAGAQDRIFRSPIANLITLRTGDVCTMLTGHTRRHLEQAATELM